MESRPEQLVTGAALLVAAMGRWPSFHDAEVLRIERIGDDLRVQVHVFEMTNRTYRKNGKDYFVLDKHHVVTFELRGVTTCPAGADPDTLDRLHVERTATALQVTFESVIDPERTWTAECRELAVVAVTPGER